MVARVKAKPGMEGRVRQELEKLLAPTRSEHGCINYDMHQATTDPALFLFHENLPIEADLDRHLQAPHLQNWTRLLVRDVDVSLFMERPLEIPPQVR